MGRLATKTKIDLIDLVRPGGWGDSCLSVEKLFGVFQWMVKTAHEAEPGQTHWGSCGPLELLSKKPTCVNHYEVDPVSSLSDLSERFHYALLDGPPGPSVKKWRKDNGIDINATRWVYFRHRSADWLARPGREWREWRTYPSSATWDPRNVGLVRSPGAIKRQVEALLGATGKTKVRLNEYHADADNVYGGRVAVMAEGFRFLLSYGVDGSSWDHPLAVSRGGEAFIDTLDRACEELARVAIWPEQLAEYA
jgi:hypothetical protein